MAVIHHCLLAPFDACCLFGTLCVLAYLTVNMPDSIGGLLHERLLHSLDQLSSSKSDVKVYVMVQPGLQARPDTPLHERANSQQPPQ